VIYSQGLGISQQVPVSNNQDLAWLAQHTPRTP